MASLEPLHKQHPAVLQNQQRLRPWLVPPGEKIGITSSLSSYDKQSHKPHTTRTLRKLYAERADREAFSPIHHAKESTFLYRAAALAAGGKNSNDMHTGPRLRNGKMKADGALVAGRWRQMVLWSFAIGTDRTLLVIRRAAGHCFGYKDVQGRRRVQIEGSQDVEV